MKKYPAVFAFFLICFFTCKNVCAQDDEIAKDSIRKVINSNVHDTSKALSLLDYGGLMAYTLPDSAAYYYQRAAAICRRLNFYHGYQKFVTYQTEIYNIGGKFDSAILLCAEGLTMAEQHNDAYFTAVHLTNTGNAFLYQSDNDSATFYLLKAATSFEKIKDNQHLGTVLANLAVAFSNMGQYKRAIDYDKQALLIAENTNDEIGKGYAYSNLGGDYLKMKIYDSAKYYAAKGRAIAQKKGDLSLEKDVTINLGLLENNAGNYINAIGYFSAAINISEKLESNQGILAGYNGMADAYYRKNDYDSSLNILLQAMHLEEKGNFRKELSDNYYLQYQNYKALHNEGKALDAFVNYASIKDSITDENVQKNISQLEQKFQSERREKQLLQSNLQIAQQTVSLRSKNMWIYVLIAVLLLLVALGYFVYKYMNQKQTTLLNAQKLNELQIMVKVKEEERSRIAAELHDDIGSTLSGINLYGLMALQQIENNRPDESKASMGKIVNNVQAVLSQLNDLVWELRPHDETVETIQKKLRNYLFEITKPAAIKIQFDYNNNSAGKFSDTESAKQIYLIAKEAINNAVKYAACKNIYITLDVSDTKLLLSVKDDGDGFDITKTPDGNGLHNMQKRADDIKAVLTIDSSTNGTIITLQKLTQLG